MSVGDLMSIRINPFTRWYKIFLVEAIGIPSKPTLEFEKQKKSLIIKIF